MVELTYIPLFICIFHYSEKYNCYAVVFLTLTLFCTLAYFHTPLARILHSMFTFDINFYLHQHSTNVLYTITSTQGIFYTLLHPSLSLHLFYDINIRHPMLWQWGKACYVKCCMCTLPTVKFLPVGSSSLGRLEGRLQSSSYLWVHL